MIKTLLALALSLNGIVHAKKPPRKSPKNGNSNVSRGIVVSDQADFGIMTTIRGKVSIARFYDKSLNKICYVSLKHASDDIQAISCISDEK